MYTGAESEQLSCSCCSHVIKIANFNIYIRELLEEWRIHAPTHHYQGAQTVLRPPARDSARPHRVLRDDARKRFCAQPRVDRANTFARHCPAQSNLRSACSTALVGCACERSRTLQLRAALRAAMSAAPQCRGVKLMSVQEGVAADSRRLLCAHGFRASSFQLAFLWRYEPDEGGGSAERARESSACTAWFVHSSVVAAACIAMRVWFVLVAAPVMVVLQRMWCCRTAAVTALMSRSDRYRSSDRRCTAVIALEQVDSVIGKQHRGGFADVVVASAVGAGSGGRMFGNPGAVRGRFSLRDFRMNARQRRRVRSAIRWPPPQLAAGVLCVWQGCM